MEIADYLRVARRRLWVLILVPILAAGVMAATVILAAPTYTATAWVAAPALVGGSFGNQFSGSQGTSQYVAAFKAFASGPQVLNVVSKELGITQPALADKILVAQDGASTVMTVTVTDTVKDRVDPAARGVARETLAGLFSTQVDLSNAQLDAARDAVAEANSAIADWESENKIVDPEQTYQSILSQINNLQQQEITMTANGNEAGRAAAKAARAARQEELKKYASLLSGYRPLVAARTSAEASLTTAKQAQQAALAQSLAANPDKVVFVTQVRAIGKSSDVFAKVVPVFGASIFLAIGLVFILELLARGRGSNVPVPQRPRTSRREPEGVATVDDDERALTP